MSMRFVSTAPGHADRPHHLNEAVQEDVMWIDVPSGTGARQVAILVMVDVATRYMAARSVPDEQGVSLQKAFER